MRSDLFLWMNLMNESGNFINEALESASALFLPMKRKRCYSVFHKKVFTLKILTLKSQTFSPELIKNIPFSPLKPPGT